MKLFRILILVLACTQLHADIPRLRECTLTAPLTTLSTFPASSVKPYRRGDEAVLKTKGLLLPPAAGKNIEAMPTGDNTTAFRAAINYHRALHKGDVDAIASYWHPAERERVRAHFAKPGVADSAKDMFGRLQNVDLLGLLMIHDREVVFIRYTKSTMPFVCVDIGGEYFLVSDPSIGVETTIASASIDAGTAKMSAPE
ncbi:MAG: hypothetical protein ACQKBV_03075 [Puniceicoccales bacterium]